MSGEGQVRMLELDVREPPGAWAMTAGRDKARAHAFQRAMDTQLSSAYRLAAVILGDRVEAEDAVHDAILVAWRGFGTLRDPDRFDAWFGRILVNTCRDRLRRTRRRRLVDLGRELTDTEHPASPDDIQRAADRDAVERALDHLPVDERIAIVLRFHLDLTVPVIAHRLGVAEGTVKSRLHHALGVLRRALEDDQR
jgi:RNA polymerase sigma-70 factor (ECF subfamily)